MSGRGAGLAAAPVWLLAAAMASGLSGPATAQVPVLAGAVPSLSMNQAVDQAVGWHPLVRNARGRLMQVGEGIDAARAGYYPRIRAGVNSQASNTNIGNYDSRHVQRAELTVSQTLYDFGKVDGEVGRAQAAHGASRAQVLLSFDEVARDTAQAWVEVRRNQALVAVAQDQVDAVASLADLARQREVMGASTHSDTVQADARVDAARVELLTAQSQLQRWRTTLMHKVGAGAPAQIQGPPLSGLLEACAAEAAPVGVGAASLRAASAVQVAEAQLEVARADADIAKAQLKPTLSVDASLGRGLNDSSRRPGEHGADASVMLNFSMPLYEGGRLQADRRAAAYAVSAARSALDQARLDTDQGLQDAMLQWLKFSSRLKVQQAREESMRVARILYREQYLQLGTRTLLDLLNAEQEYHSARSDQIDSENEMVRLGLECLFYRGRLRAAFELDDVVAAAVANADGLGVVQ